MRRGEIPDNFWKHVGNVIADIDDVAIGMYRTVVNPDYQVSMFHLASQTEHIPNPESRVCLLTKRDQLGMHRVGLNWQLSPSDKRTLRGAYEIIGQEVGRAGVGRIRLLLAGGDDTIWPIWMRGAWHHMGTTRMHSSSK